MIKFFSSIVLFVFLGVTGLLPSSALAGGCAPAPLGGMDWPPCCATTDMSAGGRCLAPARQYQLTLHSFGFERSDSSELRFGGPRLFDAAGVSAGAVIGDYLSGIDLPPATYVALRPALAEQVSLSVNSLTADGRRCSGSLSTTIRQADGTPYPSCAAGQPDAATPVCRGGGVLKFRDSHLGAFTISEQSSLRLNISFDVNNAVICTFPAGTGSQSGLEHGVMTVHLSKS